jgi:hypothetical protein
VDRVTPSAGCLLLLFLIVAHQPRLQGQVPRYQPGVGQRPYLRAPGYSGPPLSTALPTAGPYSAGIHMRAPAATGTTPGMGGVSYYPQSPAYRNVVQETANLGGSYLPVWTFNGQSMASYAQYRGMTRGLRF